MQLYLGRCVRVEGLGDPPHTSVQGYRVSTLLTSCHPIAHVRFTLGASQRASAEEVPALSCVTRHTFGASQRASAEEVSAASSDVWMLGALRS